MVARQIGFEKESHGSGLRSRGTFSGRHNKEKTSEGEPLKEKKKEREGKRSEGPDEIGVRMDAGRTI